EGPHADVEGRVDHLPRLSRVVRPVERGPRGLDRRVDGLRARGRDGDRDPSEFARREPGGDTRPVDAAVDGAPEAGAGASRTEEIGLPPEVPHRRVDALRVLRIDRDVRATGGGVDEERLLPRLAAVGSPEQAAFRVVVPEVAERGDE